jgi:predicted nucleic acid-binding protein
VLRSSVEGLDELWSQVSVVEISEELTWSAGDLAEQHGLRGYDAVHLAAAVLVHADVFSSADRKLCDTASASAFHVANPLGSVSGETASLANEIPDDPPVSSESGEILDLGNPER